MYIRSIFLIALVSIAVAQDCCDLNKIIVTGNAEVKVKPDFATIEIGAEAQEKTTSAALQTLNKEIDELIKIIKAQGIADKDYSTSSLRLSQVYNYQNGENVLVGQKASQTFSVKIRDITADGAAIGKLIDAASKINGIIVNGVTFDQSDRTLGVKQARKAAFDAAKKKADEYADLTGQRARRAVRIEAIDGGSIIPYYVRAAVFQGGSDVAKTLVPVRDVTISQRVKVWWALTP